MFDLAEIQGYSPIQLDRYWRLVRAANTVPTFFNSATFQSVDPAVMRLFGVGWVIAPTKQGPPPALPFPPSSLDIPVLAPRAVAREGVFTLYRYLNADPRASVVHDVRTVPPSQGLATVLDRYFAPAAEAIVQDLAAGTTFGPPLPPGVSNGSARYAELTPEHVRIAVTNRGGPALVVIRNPFDRNWAATVDGRPQRVLQTDYLMQGVAVPHGTHIVELAYRDRAIGQGVAASAGGWLVLLGLTAWLWRRERRGRQGRRGRRAQGRPGDGRAEPGDAPDGGAGERPDEPDRLIATT
jgi:hypothetical protein